MLGKNVFQTEVNTLQLNIDTKDFQPGIYFLQIQNQNSSVLKKVVKE